MKLLFFLLILLISTAGAEVSVSINTWNEDEDTSVSLTAFNAEVNGWMLLMPMSGNFTNPDGYFAPGVTAAFSWHSN
jgi:hypothetical protein